MNSDKKITLLIIDAQFDFCAPQGALYVPGAEQDVERLVALISRASEQIGHIVATLDTHQVLDIAHPGFWKNTAGQSPEPFTPISSADVENGTWVPRFDVNYARQYVHSLEEQDEFQHFIWPEHCLAGTHGAALVDSVARALREWSHRSQRNYQTVTKGEHPLAEHFGVFRAQIPVPGSPKTELNQHLLDELAQNDEIWIAGEARSHCVATSLRQIMKYAPSLVPKVIMLTDCMSDVTGLGYLADPIYAEARKLGVRFTTSVELMP
ncbi:isochorismatase family protein [Salmonirosea aquatica]|uniref:Isochorismatase family protein n=1 Tax=Salmonirosea aquatica TaxID=2654236 RepID=A0A7C9FQ30_9BACT|nr:isochorismatase family protein [Cytophagaceae bacterium SJW1-29]